MGVINFAKLETSKRLQRVHALLSDGKPHTTLDIVIGARVCAVNSCVAELRMNGCQIECVHKSVGRFEYRMLNEGGQQGGKSV